MRNHHGAGTVVQHSRSRRVHRRHRRGGSMTTARRVVVLARRALLASALGAGLVLPGCATKKDVRTLQEAMVQMQAHQDSAMRELQPQQAINQRMVMDTV